ncbi:hypothetical protein [Arthrobacter roseus]|uniref:hypothetical protein n=1 Tax=Arthrobacter roseus TaxID=136274 RepID=UPI0019662D46|nr:hypothetical protein [Arthrobacter roseus]MBM7849371.1 hypothetical protein [Arthrobacter roseus]
MVYDAERDKRDIATRDFHDARVAAGDGRILARGNDAELYSYAMEEYGVLRAGPGPVMTTLWGHMVYTGLIFLGLIGYIWMYASLYVRPIPTPPWGGWLLAAAILAVLLYAARNLKIEWHADKIRKERGLPTPTDSPIWVGTSDTSKEK